MQQTDSDTSSAVKKGTSAEFELYSGRVKQTGRFWEMPGVRWSWQTDSPPLFRFSWYDDVLGEIRLQLRALQAAADQKKQNTSAVESTGDTGLSVHGGTSPLEAAMKAYSEADEQKQPRQSTIQQSSSPAQTRSKAAKASEDDNRKRKRQLLGQETGLRYLQAQAAAVGVPTTEGNETAGELLSKVDAMRHLRATVDAGCVYYQVIGTSGLGKATFGKWLIYELGGRQPLPLRPDVLYVHRGNYHNAAIEYSEQAAHEAVHMDLLYCKDGALEYHRFHNNLDRIPETFWNLRDSTRPLYVIIDTCLPIQVLDTIQGSSAAWFASMQLCVYVASEASLYAAQRFCGRDRAWPFLNVRPVPAMTEEDHLLCGYVCASEDTRKFLRDTAGIAAEDFKAGCTDTPKRIIPILKYMYHIMGGSPLSLLCFVTRCYDCSFYRACDYKDLFDTLATATRGYAIKPAVRKAVLEHYVNHIGYVVNRNSAVPADEIAELFYRLVADEDDTSGCYPCRRSRRAYASAAMECVVRHLIKGKGTAARKLKREFMEYIGEAEVGDIMELSAPHRELLVPALEYRGLFGF